MTLPLVDPDDSTLLIVDMQTRLAAAMEPVAWARVRDSTRLLARAAGELGLPVVVSQQYPTGLGPTAPEIVADLPAQAQTLDKTCFSVAGDDDLAEALRMTGRDQVVICGMEAHVCVLQSAAGLAAAGYRPFVVADAVCSRDDAHSANALDRMRASGLAVTNRESVLFEWLRDARHDRFRAVTTLLK